MDTNEVRLLIEANRVTNAMIEEMHKDVKQTRVLVDKHEVVYKAGKWTIATGFAIALGWLGLK